MISLGSSFGAQRAFESETRGAALDPDLAAERGTAAHAVAHISNENSPDPFFLRTAAMKIVLPPFFRQRQPARTTIRTFADVSL